MRMREKLQRLLDESTETISYLYGRWQDEKEYEDIADYRKPLEKHFNNIGAVIVKMTKRPFGCIFDLDGRRLKLKVTAQKIAFGF